ncbi:hypothetical protein L596_003447 [Steinernema carpocapsae]|uniref:Uncharacterized protein n=1 Tax=Steinernema carpocapsae TaxID=34508 RepID=A0A4U8USI6_STECR|nr:hypothetical protein L596_003447 [Steinernema carpocapsae]
MRSTDSPPRPMTRADCEVISVFTSSHSIVFGLTISAAIDVLPDDQTGTMYFVQFSNGSTLRRQERSGRFDWVLSVASARHRIFGSKQNAAPVHTKEVITNAESN